MSLMDVFLMKWICNNLIQLNKVSVQITSKELQCNKKICKKGCDWSRNHEIFICYSHILVRVLISSLSLGFLHKILIPCQKIIMMMIMMIFIISLQGLQERVKKGFFKFMRRMPLLKNKVKNFF